VATPPQALPINGGMYAMMAAAGDQFEIQSSQIALTKAVSPDVRNFAQTLINDHTLMSQKLSAAALAAGLTAPVPILTADQQQMISDLQAASSLNFDQMFLRDQIIAHQMALALHSNYAAVGDTAALRVVASSAVPIIQGHLNTATTLMIANGGMLASAFCPAKYWCNSDVDALGTSFSVCCPSDVPLLPPVALAATLYTPVSPAPLYTPSVPTTTTAASIPVSGSGVGSLVCVGGMCAVYGTATAGTR
jgi:putative membrane protein